MLYDNLCKELDCVVKTFFNDDKIIKKYTDTAIKLFSIFTIDELIDFASLKSEWDVYERLKENKKVMKLLLDQFKENDGEQIEAVLKTIIKNNLRPKVTDKSKIINEFKTTYFMNDDTFVITVSSYMECLDKLIKSLVKNYDFLRCKYYLEYIEKISQQCNITFQNYKIWWRCDCGRYATLPLLEYKNIENMRESCPCCMICGRSSAAWKKISGRHKKLIYRIKSGKFIKRTTIKEITLGLEESKFEQFDYEYDKYLYIRNKIQKKSKKTLKDSKEG